MENDFKEKCIAKCTTWKQMLYKSKTTWSLYLTGFFQYVSQNAQNIASQINDSLPGAREFLNPTVFNTLSLICLVVALYFRINSTKAVEKSKEEIK